MRLLLCLSLQRFRSRVVDTACFINARYTDTMKPNDTKSIFIKYYVTILTQSASNYSLWLTLTCPSRSKWYNLLICCIEAMYSPMHLSAAVLAVTGYQCRTGCISLRWALCLASPISSLAAFRISALYKTPIVYTLRCRLQCKLIVR